MHLIVDGIVYRSQSYGGVSRVFDNILPKMCEISPGLEITLVNRSMTYKDPPSHKNIHPVLIDRFEQYLRPWRLWHKFYPTVRNKYLELIVGKSEAKFWFSTYYTIPPFKWKGSQVVFAHDFIQELFPNMLPDSEQSILMKRNSLLNADAVICNTYNTAKDMKSFYSIPSEKTFVAHLGCDKIFTKRDFLEIENKLSFPFILYVGGRKFYKGFETLMMAYSRWSRNKEIKLIVVGPPCTSDEKEFLLEKKLAEQVVFLNSINDSYLCDLYNQALAFVHTSSYEGFGIPLLEAMACGCPVVATCIPTSIEVAGNVPYYFVPGDVDLLINALDQATNDGRDNSHVVEGLMRVNCFSWDNTARKVLDVFQKLYC